MLFQQQEFPHMQSTCWQLFLLAAAQLNHLSNHLFCDLRGGGAHHLSHGWAWSWSKLVFLLSIAGVVEPIPGSKEDPGIGHQSILVSTHRHMDILGQAMGNLKSLINLDCMYLDCGVSGGHGEDMQTPHTKVPGQSADSDSWFLLALRQQCRFPLEGFKALLTNQRRPTISICFHSVHSYLCPSYSCEHSVFGKSLGEFQGILESTHTQEWTD